MSTLTFRSIVFASLVSACSASSATDGAAYQAAATQLYQPPAAGAAAADASAPDASAPTAPPDAAAPTTQALPDLRCQAAANVAQRVDYAQPGPYEAGTLELTFEDASRPIAATEKHPAAPSRRLVTTLYYPSRRTLLPPAPAADGGPFPLLMYSHGYSSTRNEGAPVATHAASHGYIVVAPDFPLTNMGANDGAPDIEDTVNQPGDVSFLIDQLLALSKDPAHVLANAVDETRIGALGVSLGGLTTLLVSLHPQLHDPRIRVAMPIAAPSSFFAQGFYHTREVPLLLLHGDIDAFIEYERNARRSLERAGTSARLISVAKGSHAAFGAQLDATTVALLNSLLAPEGAHPSNPDGLGCGAVGSTLQMTRSAFLASLGGAENFIEPDPDPKASVPCLGDQYKQPAMDAYEQEAIAVASASAYFDAHFALAAEQRADGCRYLLQELTKNPAVTLE
jgi:dienelactone hydrolase